jgi:hypothetical protein
MAKLIPRGLLPEKEIKCPPQQDNNGPKAIWIGFHTGLHERFIKA